MAVEAAFATATDIIENRTSLDSDGMQAVWPEHREDFAEYLEALRLAYEHLSKDGQKKAFKKQSFTETATATATSAGEPSVPPVSIPRVSPADVAEYLLRERKDLCEDTGRLSRAFACTLFGSQSRIKATLALWSVSSLVAEAHASFIAEFTHTLACGLLMPQFFFNAILPPRKLCGFSELSVALFRDTSKERKVTARDVYSVPMRAREDRQLVLHPYSFVLLRVLVSLQYTAEETGDIARPFLKPCPPQWCTTFDAHVCDANGDGANRRRGTNQSKKRKKRKRAGRKRKRVTKKKKKKKEEEEEEDEEDDDDEEEKERKDEEEEDSFGVSAIIRVLTTKHFAAVVGECIDRRVWLRAFFATELQRGRLQICRENVSMLTLGKFIPDAIMAARQTLSNRASVQKRSGNREHLLFMWLGELLRVARRVSTSPRDKRRTAILAEFLTL